MKTRATHTVGNDDHVTTGPVTGTKDRVWVRIEGRGDHAVVLEMHVDFAGRFGNRCMLAGQGVHV